MAVMPFASHIDVAIITMKHTKYDKVSIGSSIGTPSRPPFTGLVVHDAHYVYPGDVHH